jgi:HEAT repeat protein
MVRESIFQALLRIEDDAALAGAIQQLDSDHPHVRNLAVNLLQHKGSVAIPFLERAMREGGRDTRKFVLDALSGIQSEDAGEIYAAALLDQDVNVVITAVEKLGNLRKTEFRSRIENLLQEDSHPMLMAVCLEALAQIGNESSLAVIERYCPNLTALPSFCLTPCLKAIAALGGEREFKRILDLLPAPKEQFYPPILGSLIQLYERGVYRHSSPPEPSESLLAALRSLVESHHPPSWRYQAARVLGFWSDREDVSDSLVAGLSSLEKMVRLGAAEALRTSSRPGLEVLLASHEARETEREVKQALTR